MPNNPFTTPLTRKSAIRLICAAAAGIFFEACASPSGTRFAEQSPLDAPTTLQPGDVIRLTFPGAPELSQSQTIRPDGKISLPLLGELSAAGKKFGAFQTELANLYKPQLKNTEVVVSLESSVTPTVIVDGAVRRPGSVNCERPTTVFDAIMQAGGFAPEANLRSVRLFRLIKGVHRCEVIDMRGALSGVPVSAIPVRGGDVIFVPEKALNF